MKTEFIYAIIAVLACGVSYVFGYIKGSARVTDKMMEELAYIAKTSDRLIKDLQDRVGKE